MIPHFKISNNELSCILFFGQASYIEALRKAGLAGAKAGLAFRYLCEETIKCECSIKKFSNAIAILKGRK